MVKGFGEKVIVYGKVILVIAFIGYLVVAEWYVADCQIKQCIRCSGLFKACDENIGFLIELLGNPAWSAPRKLYQLKS